MKHYIKQFFLRGMFFGGFGPIIAGIIYFILSMTLESFTLSGTDVCIAIISTYLLAFIQAGASIFNQIEEWPLARSLLFHFLFTYLSYVGCYLVNSWIPFEPMGIAIFTAIFAVVYLVIWLVVYCIIKQTSKKMNEALK